MSRHGALYQDVVPFTSRYYDKGKFGRIFPSLAPFALDSEKVRKALQDMGTKNGIMDAKEDLSKGPVELILDAKLQLKNPNSPVMTAGITFLG
jgi:hypothetical protein